MTYEQWVQWLELRHPMPAVRPGLERMQRALADSGLSRQINPERVIHIAGTNGKGSTAVSLEALLRSAGQSVGLYTSPHLVETTERIRRDARPISRDEFCSLCQKYSSLIEQHHLTHFEALTLFSVDCFFAGTPVDWAIFEIGLGGTWDATNAIDHRTSVIATLGYDHMHILGLTLEEIADNKFGIIQRHNKVFHLVYPPAVRVRLSRRALLTNSVCTEVHAPSFSLRPDHPLPQYVLESPWGPAPLALLGARSAETALLALTVFDGLGYDCGEHLSALRAVQWPARMSRFPYPSPAPIYLSGDHNLQGLESLREILSQADYERLYVIFGLSKNRSHSEFFSVLDTIARCEIVLTRPSFQGVVPQQNTYPYFENPKDALDFAAQKSTMKDLIVVTGSLYLCGDILRLRPARPDV